MNELKTTTQLSDIEKVIVGGDLSKLSADQRMNYYMQICSSLGLNPLTKPFEYITFNGKLTLYANRNCAEQLRRVYKVSITDMEQSLSNDIITVTVKGEDKNHRKDVASGTVCLTGLKGEALANAYLKAETKAKRRLTLSLCGLGMLDETEVETIPSARKIEHPESMPSNSSQSRLPATRRGSNFGMTTKKAVEKHKIGFPDLTDRLFEALLPYYGDTLDKYAGSGWKEKGAAMAEVYESVEEAEQAAISQTIESIAMTLAERTEEAYADAV